MKRDLDLIRTILTTLENQNSTIADVLSIEGYDDGLVAFHVNLLIDAGLIKGIQGEELGGIITAMAGSITWNGYEFLDASRNKDIWEKAKKMLKDRAISIPFSMFNKLLILFLEEKIKSSFG